MADVADEKEPRPGMRTSELWLSVVVVAGCFVIAAVRVCRGQDPGLAELLPAALAAVGYAGSRAWVKS